jgi:hypothetical protein
MALRSSLDAVGQHVESSRLVRMRAHFKNQLDALAKNEGWLAQSVWSPKRREQLLDRNATMAKRRERPSERSCA